MNAPVSQAALDAAGAYDALMVPALFGPWAPVVADAGRIAEGERVLDVACGTGVLAREVAQRVGEEGFVAGVDANEGMLALAGRLSPDIEWRHGRAESLPYPDQSFDAVVSQFGLMFFADRIAALREALRVLEDGGRLAFAVFDAIEGIPAYAAELALLQRIGGVAAAEALRAPFALGDPRRLARLLEEAGAAAVDVQTKPGRARFPGVRIMVEADLRGWLPVMGVDLDEPTIERILGEAEAVLEPYVTPGGEVEFDIAAHIVTGERR